MKDKKSNSITFLKYGFYLKRLSFFQYFALSTLLLFHVFLLVEDFFKYNIDLTYLKVGCIVVLWWLPLISGMANMFRNLYFSLFWLIVCFLWSFVYFTPVSNIFPLITFGFIHIARIIFKFIFQKEPIFLVVSRFELHNFDKIERRKSNRTDFIFSMITFILGTALPFLLIYFKMI
jgi:hypothetical protein